MIHRVIIFDTTLERDIALCRAGGMRSWIDDGSPFKNGRYKLDGAWCGVGDPIPKDFRKCEYCGSITMRSVCETCGAGA